MADDFRVRRLQTGHMKIKNVPIAVTPEGFWCCPSPAGFQKPSKTQGSQNKQRGATAAVQTQQPTSTTTATQQPQPKPSSTHRTQNHSGGLERKPSPSANNSTQQRPRTVLDDHFRSSPNGSPLLCHSASATTAVEGAIAQGQQQGGENVQRKISVGFGQQETSDLKVVLSGKEGIAVRMNVHRNVLMDHSSYFADRLSKHGAESTVEIGDCEDVEIYVETVGLMYCKEMKPRMVRQSVSRVLRILKIAESLGFHACISSCLEYLEAAPWVGDEEENVVSSIRRLQNNRFGVSPILKRVSSDVSNPPNDTLARILELVLKSSEDRGRREMKSLVLKLLKENSVLSNGSSTDLCVDILYNSCQRCVDSLLALYRQAVEPQPESANNKPSESKDPIFRQIALEADNILWLVEMMADKHVADDFTVTWANQDELAQIHCKLPIVSRHLVSCVTSRLFVGIGKGEILPSKETRHLLLQVWLQPLMEDYNWLQHGCRSFDRKVVEEGIGRTILTLPLEDQQSILLTWLGSFLIVGDRCPNLQRAFEVWWRRTFVRPYVEQNGVQQQNSDKSV